MHNFGVIFIFYFLKLSAGEDFGNQKFHVKCCNGETTSKLLGIILDNDNDDISAENPEEKEGAKSILYHC